MTNATTPQTVEFERPPVAEVSISVTFQPLDRLRSFEILEIWSELFKEELPSYQQQAPLIPQIERFGMSANQPQMRVQFLAQPPEPRYWFLNESGTSLVQIQQDWFARNWRKIDPTDVYPRFDAVREPFKCDLERLTDFLSSKGYGELEPAQCEVSYINPIETEQLSNVSSLLRYWRDLPGDFLPAPEDLQAHVRYVIKDSQGENAGRFHANVQPAVRATDNVPIYLLNLTARGAPASPSIEDVMSFVDTCHVWIVNGFADITSVEMHEEWGKIDVN
jgi:uncharacterized protein (TIGR04255 family)